MVRINFLNKTRLIKKLKFSFLLLLFLEITSFIITPIGSCDDATISVDPPSVSVIPDYSFDLDIYCIPDKPIKAFELKLLFNSSIVSVGSVTEGDIFSGYSTFYNSGIIDNSEGSIINVYGLIIGQGNVTGPGTLVTISFTSKSEVGTSDIALYDVGITNETSYMSILTSDGLIQVQYPEINHIVTSENPENNTNDVSIGISSLSVSINDPEGDPFYWEITTSPDIGSNFGNNATNGTKTCEVSDLGYGTTYNWYVKCKDVTTNKWTNKSFTFSTEEEPVSPPSGGGGGGGGIIPPAGDQGNENIEPNKPQVPSGSVYIEKDISYLYSSVSYDNDGDQIRYRFDWGDGTFSDWSELIDSNISVSMQHSWNQNSDYDVKVICQDENGANSSWSDPLNVIVSSANASDNYTVIEINVENDSCVSNQTVYFDAYESFNLDGVFVNFTWDFGDGNIGYGINVSHIYHNPGEYMVTLTVIDNDGNSYSSSKNVNIETQSDKSNVDNKSNVGNLGEDIHLFLVPIIVIIVVLAIIIIVFRQKIGLSLLDYKIHKIKNDKNKGKSKK